MKKAVHGNKLLLKAVCLGLVLTVGACLIAAGITAASDCAVKCCCLSEPTSSHHAPQDQIRSSMGCCSGSSQMPCDLVAAAKVQFPETSLASSRVRGHLPTGIGLANPISVGVICRYAFRSGAFNQSAQVKFRPPPLYLQKLSFLI